MILPSLISFLTNLASSLPDLNLLIKPIYSLHILIWVVSNIFRLPIYRWLLFFISFSFLHRNALILRCHLISLYLLVLDHIILSIIPLVISLLFWFWLLIFFCVLPLRRNERSERTDSLSFLTMRKWSMCTIFTFIHFNLITIKKRINFIYFKL